jgi:molybdate transport system substrate-binding protein
MRFISTVLLVFGPLAAAAGEVHVAVASNFLAPAKVLAEEFEARTGHEVTVSTGSTGKLYAQVVNGAPYDVFLAANAREPLRLEQEGRAVAGSGFTYALGRLVLWSRDDRLGADDGATVLTAGRFRRLALANPQTAPYGAAAVETMHALGLYETLQPRLVRGENVSQALQYGLTGNTELAFVAMSQVLVDEVRGTYWAVPEDLYPPIRQRAVLLVHAADNRAAAELMSFLKEPATAARIRGFGYAVEVEGES